MFITLQNALTPSHGCINKLGIQLLTPEARDTNDYRLIRWKARSETRPELKLICALISSAVPTVFNVARGY